MSDFPAIAIVGPTASGKSGLALYLARSLGGEIVNYDSIQLYRFFDIGTAKPTPSERACVPHHLIDVLDPAELSSAGDYRGRAEAVLRDLRDRDRVPILVGGTGFYLRALIEGLFDGPRRCAYWRRRLERRAAAHGREYPHRILERLDPAAAARIAPQDLPKVIRALEVRLVTGRPLSSHLASEPRRPIAGFAFTLVGLDPPRDALHERIGRRVTAMFEAGLVSEVRQILNRGVGPDAAAFRAIGYRQVLEYIDGNMSIEEAIMHTERDTRRYAKRQVTWFRRQHSAVWFDGFGDDRMVREAVLRSAAGLVSKG